MPPREPALEIDFVALVIADEDFAKVYRANDGRIDFHNPQHLQQLTKSILKRDFGLKIELLSDRLCPPVPVRYQYIRWLQGLLDTTSHDYSDQYDAIREVVGIDIGVGASCIYPLLGCASRPAWRFSGTEVDDTSLQAAQNNVAVNDLQTRISLQEVDPKGPILPLDSLAINHADFVMCNPPFFESKEDMLATHKTKTRSPSAVCTGADVEMITEGGDRGFVTRIIEESAKLNSRVQWYSSMLGKLASVFAVVGKLRDMGVNNWAVTSLQAGNVTKRWAVAWSFDDFRPANDIARGDLANKEILPFPTRFDISGAGPDQATCMQIVDQTLKDLQLTWRPDTSTSGGIVFANANVWSRTARRQRSKEQHILGLDHTNKTKQVKEAENDLEKSAAMAVRISVLPTGDVSLRWLRGTDHVLLESFCGMLKRALAITK